MQININRLRNILILSKSMLAEMLGVTNSTICFWESGKKKPTMKHVRAIKELCEKNGLNFYDFVIENE